jgi:hypothetical protein
MLPAATNAKWSDVDKAGCLSIGLAAERLGITVDEMRNERSV